jgi:hypothetical protein
VLGGLTDAPRSRHLTEIFQIGWLMHRLRPFLLPGPTRTLRVAEPATKHSNNCVCDRRRGHELSVLCNPHAKDAS